MIGSRQQADRYAVIGNPVEHSRSPAVHAAFARATGHALDYTALLAPLEDFTGTVERFRKSGAGGANVTLPFNEEAYGYATVLTDRARRARAVSALKFVGDDVLGDTTDGAGIVADLTGNLGVSVAGASVLVAGAGGATRGVLPSLLDEGPAALVVANRTLGRAEELASALGSRVVASSYPALEGQRFDIVINATSASLFGALPPLPASVFDGCRIAYDMLYRPSGDPRPTPFQELARELGAARTVDGLGMLVEQAAESFQLWRGVRPATAPVLATLRAAT